MFVDWKQDKEEHFEGTEDLAGCETELLCFLGRWIASLLRPGQLKGFMELYLSNLGFEGTDETLLHAHTLCTK